MTTALNGICPYFTMFPLDFPLRILSRHSRRGDVVLDPFVGRGTTLFAGRLKGLYAVGIDSSPVAVAVSAAKLANTSPGRIIASANQILDSIKDPTVVPTGEFWHLAFESGVLHILCRLREGLIKNCDSDARKALRAIILGALHGPRAKHEQSYFSNQCPRTFAPKPRYAVEFWRAKNLMPPNIDVLNVIQMRAERYYGSNESKALGQVVEGDSQDESAFIKIRRRVSWIVTSPPYYGMRSYIPDQWLRSWFVGGPSRVDYSNQGQLSHSSRDAFRDGIRKVWINCASVAKSNCRLVIRFGAINDRKIDALDLVKASLIETPWTVLTVRKAGTASKGKRQADHFVPTKAAIEEYDVWAQLC